MDELKVLSRRVKMIRLEKGVSQTNMAELIGVSQTNLSNMESGRTTITTQNLFKIREVLGCKMSDFFVDFDGEAEEAVEEQGALSKSEGASQNKEARSENGSIKLEDAVNILKLLKAVEIKGL